MCLAGGDPVGDREARPHTIAARQEAARRYARVPAVMGASEDGARASSAPGSTCSSSATRRPPCSGPCSRRAFPGRPRRGLRVRTVHAQSPGKRAPERRAAARHHGGPPSLAALGLAGGDGTEPAGPLSGLSDQVRVRHHKLDRLCADGTDPYPAGYPGPPHTSPRSGRASGSPSPAGSCSSATSAASSSSSCATGPATSRGDGTRQGRPRRPRIRHAAHRRARRRRRPAGSCSHRPDDPRDPRPFPLVRRR